MGTLVLTYGSETDTKLTNTVCRNKGYEVETFLKWSLKKLWYEGRINVYDIHDKIQHNFQKWKIYG